MLSDDLPPQRHNWSLELEERLRDILTGAGLQETINYPLTTLENHSRLYPDQPQLAPTANQFITLANPMSSEQVVMRRSMVVSALENLSRNLRYEDRLATFELGKIYIPEEGNGQLPAEKRRLSIAMTGPRNPGNWLGGDPEPLDFYDVKGMIEVMLEQLNTGSATYEAADVPYCGPHCARVLVADVEIGVFGELHPRVRQAYGLPNRPVVVADLASDPLLPYFMQKEQLQAFSEFPPVKEDIALIVDESISAGQVEALIHKTGGQMLIDVQLFDLYRGRSIPAGKKSLAYSLTFQSPTKTLTDKDTAKFRRKIVGRLSREIGAQLREA
jgi:phenylalanyl-tRNA synthetase beta chain